MRTNSLSTGLSGWVYSGTVDTSCDWPSGWKRDSENSTQHSCEWMSEYKSLRPAILVQWSVDTERRKREEKNLFSFFFFSFLLPPFFLLFFFSHCHWSSRIASAFAFPPFVSRINQLLLIRRKPGDRRVSHSSPSSVSVSTLLPCTLLRLATSNMKKNASTQMKELLVPLLEPKYKTILLGWKSQMQLQLQWHLCSFLFLALSAYIRSVKMQSPNFVRAHLI